MSTARLQEHTALSDSAAQARMNAMLGKPVSELLGEEKSKISIFGLGYVGAVSAACFCDLGHEVIGVDPDQKKVEHINKGESPIVENQLPELLSMANKMELLKATQNAVAAIIETDITFVSVGTPSSPDGSCDTTYLQQASMQIGEAIKLKDSYHLVMYRSTVPPKTTRDIMIPIIEQVSGKKCGIDFGVAFNPEFLRESTAIKDFYAPPKTVIGAFDEKAAQMAASLYEGNVEGEIIQTSIEAAEFVKYVDNTWHALKVVFGNEIGRICKAMDVDSHEVMSIFCKDTKLNLSPYYLMPGFAYGGSCLPKDTRGINHLANTLDVKIPVIKNIMKSNDTHITHAREMIEMMPGKKVGFLGITFKAGTDDLRESPTIELVKQLVDNDYEIKIFDPNFTPTPLHDTDHTQSKMNDIGTMLSTMATEDSDSLLSECDVLVVTHGDASFNDIVNQAKGKLPIIDLVRMNEYHTKSEQISGICW